MTRSSLDRPGSRPLWSNEDPPRPPAGAGDGNDGDGGRPPSRRGGPPRQGRRAVLLILAGLIGGGAGAGVVVATGAVGDDAAPTTTVVQREAATTTTTATDDGDAVLDADSLYASTSAGVVAITAEGLSSARRQQAPFGAPPRESQSTSTGTGFVIDETGHIVTASHVVDGASSITVAFEDGETRAATLLGHDDATDVAVLKVDAEGLTLQPLKLGNSSSLEVGDDVAAIGDPFGYERSLSTGIVSGVDRTIEAPNGFTVAHAIQTDAAVNPGNSGGPLLNARGEVVGIVDQIATSGSEQNAGVGFAVPIELVTSSLAQLKAGEDIEHAYLGVSTADAAENAAGATIAEVMSGGPAAAAGLRRGDVVTEFGDAPVKDANDLVAAIAAHRPGDEVEVTVDRGSNVVELTVTLGAQPEQTTPLG